MDILPLKKIFGLRFVPFGLFSLSPLSPRFLIVFPFSLEEGGVDDGVSLVCGSSRHKLRLRCLRIFEERFFSSLPDNLKLISWPSERVLDSFFTDPSDDTSLEMSDLSAKPPFSRFLDWRFPGGVIKAWATVSEFGATPFLISCGDSMCTSTFPSALRSTELVLERDEPTVEVRVNFFFSVAGVSVPDTELVSSASTRMMTFSFKTCNEPWI